MAGEAATLASILPVSPVGPSRLDPDLYCQAVSLVFKAGELLLPEATNVVDETKCVAVGPALCGEGVPLCGLLGESCPSLVYPLLQGVEAFPCRRRFALSVEALLQFCPSPRELGDR